MKEVKLPSGASLRITLSPFAVSKSLFQAVSEEVKGLKVEPTTEVDFSLFKDLLCTGLSSKKIEAAIWECMKKARYNNLPITEETFEPEECRQDYIQVMIEVAKENLLPFTKSLFAQYGDIMKKITPDQA